MRTRDIKARAEEFESQYDEAMIEELVNMVRDELEGMSVDDIDEDLWMGIFDSWELPDVGEWCFDKVQSELDDIGDQRYQQMKDEGRV